MMNIIFFGSTNYSVRILNRLILIGRAPVLVVTQPDKPKGRQLKKLPTPVKEFSLGKGLEVVTPLELGEKSFSSLLKSKKPDIFLVAAFGKIIPSFILDIPVILPVGVHPSLLPLYRGAAPINWALINGDKKTGVSLYKMDNKMDAGPVIIRKELSISADDDFIRLQDKLANLSADIIEDVLPKIGQNKFSLKKQDSSRATYAPKISKNITKIDWEKDAVSVRNLIRGLVNYQTAWSYFREKRIKLIGVSAESGSNPKLDPGQIIIKDKKRLYVQTGKGNIRVLQVQPEAKKCMPAEAFINGYNPCTGEKFY